MKKQEWTILESRERVKNKTSEQLEMMKLTSEEYYDDLERMLNRCDRDHINDGRYIAKVIDEIKEKVFELAKAGETQRIGEILADAKKFFDDLDRRKLNMSATDLALKNFAKSYGLDGLDDLSVFRDDVKKIELRIEQAWKAKMFDLTHKPV